MDIAITNIFSNMKNRMGNKWEKNVDICSIGNLVFMKSLHWDNIKDYFVYYC